MSIDTETTGDGTATIEHFGRSWSVPVKRHHKHVREIKRITRTEGGLDADDIAAIFLSPEDYDALVALDVNEPDLDEFATKIAEAMGMGSQGNSTPSATSS